jgi:hypothetical protein
MDPGGTWYASMHRADPRCGVARGRTAVLTEEIMGQAANSNRRASLDDKKERAAGRQKTRGYHEGNRDDFDEPTAGRGQVKGAFGKSGQGLADSPPGNLDAGGGGGGGHQSPPRGADSPPSSRPARKKRAK